MTQAEKLEALVRKAIEEGWQFDKRHDWIEGKSRFEVVKYIEGWAVEFYRDGKSAPLCYSVAQIIFDRDFARALFGESHSYTKEPEQTSPTPTIGLQPEWGAWPLPHYQYHLQQAVISKDPIGYMYKEVFGE